MTEHTALGDQNSILAKVFPLPKTGEEAKGSFSVDGWMDHIKPLNFTLIPDR